MEDLISRRVAIKSILDMHDCYNGFSDSYDKAAIIGVLEELPSVQEQQWIPVTERFPKKEEYVLVTETNGNVDIAWLDDIWTEDGEELIWYAGECFRINVTAWMPLPEPWKGEER